MAVGQTYQAKVKQSLFGQQVYNVFYYQQSAVVTGPVSDSRALANAWIDVVYQYLKTVTSTSLLFESVEVLCLSNPLDFWTELFDPNTTGQVAGECLPPYAAWGFIYKRETRASRNGAKRFAGVPEGLQSNGVATAGAITLLESLAGALFFTLTAASYGGGWDPKIYSRNPIALHAVSDVQYVRLTTQNTRKFGRGS